MDKTRGAASGQFCVICYNEFWEESNPNKLDKTVQGVRRFTTWYPGVLFRTHQ
jgi:hypothetical protein